MNSVFDDPQKTRQMSVAFLEDLFVDEKEVRIFNRKLPADNRNSRHADHNWLFAQNAIRHSGLVVSKPK